MKLLHLTALVVALLVPAYGQDLQQIANNLTVQDTDADHKRLKMPDAKGAQIRILGADYEQIITRGGKINRPISDTPVHVSFELTKGKQSVISKDYRILVKGKQQAKEGANPKPRIIPELLCWAGDTGQMQLPKEVTVWGTDAYMDDFIRELNELLPDGYTAKKADKAESATLVIAACKGRQDESYRLNIGQEQATITAAGATGRFWGTRTVLQMLAQQPTALPCGRAWDVPRYKVRGFMLDVGRLPIPMDYLYDVVRLMSWYKMNDLQLHLNDNYIFHEHYVDAGEDPFKKSYSAFRMESRVKGKDGTPLTAQDLFYRKDEFRKLVDFAAARGVNIVPEFDAPGHALSFTRVRPDLIYQGPMKHEKRRCEMLDAANPETLRFVCSVWDEYLQGKKPVFEGCKVVHVGADEFFGAAEDYRRFADGLLRHILKRQHTPRIWGSLKAKPGKTPVQVKGVQMNLWSKDWGTAWQSVNQGYDVIVTFDRSLYVVPFANYYRADNNRKNLYETWQPNRFHDETLPAGHPRLLGASFAVWNDCIDRLHSGYGAYDIWPVIDGMVNVLSQKMWGRPAAPLTYDAHCELAAQFSRIPCCNPLHLGNEKLSIRPNQLPMKAGKGSRGPAYHLSMELQLNTAPTPGEEQVLLESDQGQLLAAGKDGRITLRRSDSMEFAFDAKLPVGKRVRLELIGTMGSTELILDGVSAGTPHNIRFPLHQKDLKSTFVLPLETIGSSFKGEIYSIEL